MMKDYRQAVRSLLGEWARWGALQNIGYPKMAAFFGERALKTPLYGSGYCAPEVQLVEQAVCKLEPWERMLIIHKYQWHMSLAEIAQRHQYSKSTAKRKIDEAEYAVYIGINAC